MSSEDSPPSPELAALVEQLRDAENATREALKRANPEDPLGIATAKLLAVHEQIRTLAAEKQAEIAGSDECDVYDAAIEINREEHTMKPNAKDVLKALFMWRDDPVERAKSGKG